MDLSLLYRGPLASCNYDCAYCPFAKRRDSPATLRADREALERFTDWVTRNPDGDRLSVLFTPWGEGLTRTWYQRALADLSQLPHVGTVAIQTNLSAKFGWMADADFERLALWATYHPTQIAKGNFLARCETLRSRGVRFSVGIVGLPAHYEDARWLRKALPEDVYLWVNAAEGHVYTPGEERVWAAIDPLFSYSVRPHVSAGQPCRTGDTVLSVRGDGSVRRCHFVDSLLGNLYDGSYRAALRPRTCPLPVCDCHIGYVHLETLPLYDVFAGGILERIPARF
ncbi:STM4011 family radical SAM protein [Cryptosporangium sp. NPDC048952]|uniref:STM4011 family radical SAM protein n=1 Tax=Cryptosporangium sp. NPDC048952 TaxID=3363961 RepID=UPI0037193739